MEPSNFGMPQNPDPYVMPTSNSGDKKKLFIMIGGLVVLVVLLLLLLTSGGGNPSQTQLRKTVEHTNNSVGMLDEYLDDISHDGTKNDLSLVLILLRGNQKNLTELYEKTFPKAKKLPNSPKPTEEAVDKLESAKRNNVLDDEIIKLIKAEIAAAETNLRSAKPHFTRQQSRQTILTAQEDLSQVADILNTDR